MERIILEAIKKSFKIRKGKKVVVRKAKKGYKIVTVNGRKKEVKMSSKELSKRKRGAKKGARKAKSKRKSALRKRRMSLKKRRSVFRNSVEFQSYKPLFS